MALKNVFENVATESGQGELAQLVRVLRNLVAFLTPDATNPGMLRVLATPTSAVSFTVIPASNAEFHIGRNGGWFTQYDQPGQMMIHAAANRNRITVS